MKIDELEATWRLLDRRWLENVARRGPEPVFATVSGAHLYGFASPDSDVDLRGAFLLPLRDVLGLHSSPETITVAEKSPVDLDWVAHDLRKFARMLTSHNGYALEQLFSPLVVLSTPAFEELRELGLGCVTRPTASPSSRRESVLAQRRYGSLRAKPRSTEGGSTLSRRRFATRMRRAPFPKSRRPRPPSRTS